MKQKIIYAVIAFLVAFGTTFYVIRTYFPKHKVEKQLSKRYTDKATAVEPFYFNRYK